MHNILNNIEGLFDASQDSIHQARNEIKILKMNGKKYTMKSFKVPNLLNKIVYTFFKASKAEKSYENSLRIKDFVPKALGYREFKKFKLLDKSYFVSEYFDYDFTIREPLLDKDFEDKEEVFKAFAKFTFDLHQNNICHLDYSPGNILIKKEEGKYIFKLVDINRMKFRNLSINQRLKSFNKLWAKDEDLEIIIKYYAVLIGIEEKDAIQKALGYSQKLKNFKNFKKRLKGIPVVD